MPKIPVKEGKSYTTGTDGTVDVVDVDADVVQAMMSCRGAST